MSKFINSTYILLQTTRSYNKGDDKKVVRNTWLTSVERAAEMARQKISVKLLIKTSMSEIAARSRVDTLPTMARPTTLIANWVDGDCKV